MFEPAFDMEDELPKVAILASFLEDDSNPLFLPLHAFNPDVLVTNKLDLLFVHGASIEEREHLTAICDQHCCVTAFIDNPSNDVLVIEQVMRNLKGKLDSAEMPNNIDIADIREIANSADYLLAFNSKLALTAFLSSDTLGSLVGAVYLAHGGESLKEYKMMNSTLSHSLTDYAYFTSSFLYEGQGECTALVAVKCQ